MILRECLHHHPGRQHLSQMRSTRSAIPCSTSMRALGIGGSLIVQSLLSVCSSSCTLSRRIAEVDTMSDQSTLAMLERRRIEAAILKHVYDTLKASHGVEVAKRAVASSVRASAMEQAGQFAAAVGGKTSMQTFIDRQELWTRGGALEREVIEQ